MSALACPEPLEVVDKWLTAWDADAWEGVAWAVAALGERLLAVVLDALALAVQGVAAEEAMPAVEVLWAAAQVPFAWAVSAALEVALAVGTAAAQAAADVVAEEMFLLGVAVKVAQEVVAWEVAIVSGGLVASEADVLAPASQAEVVTSADAQAIML